MHIESQTEGTGTLQTRNGRTRVKFTMLSYREHQIGPNRFSGRRHRAVTVTPDNTAEYLSVAAVKPLVLLADDGKRLELDPTDITNGKFDGVGDFV